MYESFYGLREKPFSLVPDPDFLFLGRLHGAALNMLEYALRGQASFTLISGEVGCGKTILVRRFLRMVNDSVVLGVVSNTPRANGHMLEHILLAFDLDHRGMGEVERYDALTRFLEAQQAAGRRAVLIIDEAHNLDEDSLEELRMLSNINVDKALILQVVLVGQPEILERLNTRSLRQLTQRISVHFSLTPLTFAETRRYIRHRLRVAGGSPEIFTAQAIALVHLLSGGIPRLINILCDGALVYGFGESQPILDTREILAVTRDILHGGLETLPGIDKDFDADEALIEADELVHSLEPADLIEEQSVPDAPPPPPAKADETDDRETSASPPYGLRPPAQVKPVFDDTAIARMEFPWRRSVFLGIAAAAVMLAAALAWFYWPANLEESPRKPAGSARGSQAIQEDFGRTAAAPPPEPVIAPLETAPAAAASPEPPVAPVASRPDEEFMPPKEEPPVAEVVETVPVLEESPGPDLEISAPPEPIAELPPLPVEEAEIPTEDAIVVNDVPAPVDTVTVTVAVSNGAGAADAGIKLQELIAGMNEMQDGAQPALNGLFDLWNANFDELAGETVCDKAKTVGLACYEERANLYRLMRLNRPAILSLRRPDAGSVQALLRGREDEKLFLRIANMETAASLPEVRDLVTGTSLILWKPPAGFEELLVEGQRGVAVLWLRARLDLVLEDRMDVGSGDLFDHHLTRAVEQFQESRNLRVDGLVGIETLIELNNAVGGTGVPKLQ